MFLRIQKLLAEGENTQLVFRCPLSGAREHPLIMRHVPVCRVWATLWKFYNFKKISHRACFLFAVGGAAQQGSMKTKFHHEDLLIALGKSIGIILLEFFTGPVNGKTCPKMFLSIQNG